MKRPDVLVAVVSRLLLAPSLVIAFALIVKGYTDVGDGFSAGVIAALAIAMRYVGMGADAAEATLPVLRHAPAVAVSGLLLALASGFFPLLLGEPPVSHRPAPGAHVTTVGALELFTPLAFDVGIFLLVVGVLTVLLHLLARRADPPTPGEERQP